MENTSRHQCLIYEGAPSEHLPSLAKTIVRKLKANHRCVYLNSPPMVAGMRSYLAAEGLNPKEEIAKGALILSSDRGHLVDGKFDMEKMLNLLESSFHRALADGYVGLWATGDMTWEFGNETNLEKLLEYERKLEEFMQKNPTMCGVCQYHKDTLPKHVIDIGLHTHKTVYINETLSRVNPEFKVS